MGHLTLEQRYRIEFCLSENHSHSQIADHIDKDRSVISRELSRNSDARNGRYKAELAHAKATERQTEKRKKKHFTADIESRVRTHLAEDHSQSKL